MSSDNLAERLRDSVGLVYDRTQSPEIYLGQVCLISKGRAIGAASTIFNYDQAPWALVVRFPGPGVECGVKVVTTSAEFDRRQARLDYLAGKGLPGESKAVLENDLATVTLDSAAPPLNAARVGELNKALTLQLDVSGDDISGHMEGASLPQIIRRALASRRDGVLSIFDWRNFPVARIGIRPGLIQKVIYRGLTGESALFELLYRKPGGVFVFRPPGSYAWPEMREITTPPDTMGAEGMRRASELPAVIARLGGSDARYRRIAAEYHPAEMSPSLQWVTDRLWTALDGYITLDNLWQRTGADTYIIATAVQEMINLGLIARADGSPFSASGILGTPVTPAQDADMMVGTTLTGFYLDPLSYRPYQLQGAFYGVTRVQAPNSLLHTLRFPTQVIGGLVFSSERLVGINSGPFVIPEGQQVAQEKLYQMVYIGALTDLGAKRLKTITAGFDTPLEAEPRRRYEEQMPEDAEEEEEAAEEAESGLIGRLRGLTGSDSKLPKGAIMIGAAVLVLATFGFAIMGGGNKKPSPVPGQLDGPGPKEKPDPLAAVKQTAVMYAGFKRQAPPTYEYVNTKELTGETISFGLNSERQNQKLLFLLWDNWGPINDLGLITGKVPYTDFVKLEQKVDSGQQGIGGGPFTWLAGRFIRAADSKIELAFVGAYRSPVEDKAVVVIGRSFSDEQPLDYNLTISVVDSMAADYSKRAIKDGAVKPGAQKPEQPVATSEEVSAYTTKVQSLVQGKFSFPEIDEESEEELRTKVMFRLDENGKLVKIELVNGSGEERYDQAVLRAINANVPYPKPPYTGKETFTVYVTASDGQIAAKAG